MSGLTPLATLLARYAAAWPDDRATAERFVAFARDHADCLWRTCVPGHITASAWILSADGTTSLLTHHKKLGRWLQLGGHVDGEGHVERAALREAQEESGMSSFTFVAWHGDVLVPLDLDVHTIPARAAEPEHLHWDVRFLLQAAAGQPIALSGESHDLRWFTDAEVAALTHEPSVLRLLQKARLVHDAAGGSR